MAGVLEGARSKEIGNREVRFGRAREKQNVDGKDDSVCWKKRRTMDLSGARSRRYLRCCKNALYIRTDHLHLTRCMYTYQIYYVCEKGSVKW